MPKVFLHLCNDSEFLLDAQGCDLPLEEIPALALRAAREMVADDALTGRIDMSYSIEVRDEERRNLHTLYFRDAVEIVGLE